MTTIKKTIALSASAAMVLSGMGATFAMAESPDAPEASGPAGVQEAKASVAASAVVSQAKVDGLFAFSQTEVATNEELAARLASASKYLCGSQVMEANQNAPVEDWTFTVSGAVKHPEVMSLAEYRESGMAKTLVMGCTCMGNPTDGNATANAEITGIPVQDLMKIVEPEDGANTIVFVSADGYEVALPYAYVMQRYSALVFAVNDAPLAESVGGSNQLWLGSTPASYFARDIVGIRVEQRMTPPPSPSSEEARAQIQNLPNVGVLYGGDVR